MTTLQFLNSCKKTLDGCFELLTKKNHDYANTNPFSNFENVSDLGMTPDQAILYMAKLKLNRIINLRNKEAVFQEDSITDLINYLIIYKAYLSRQLYTSVAAPDSLPPETPRQDSVSDSR